MGLTELKIKVSKDCVPGFKEESISLPFLVARKCLHFFAHGPVIPLSKPEA